MALRAVQNGMPKRKAAKRFKIPETDIIRHRKMSKNIKKRDCQTVLSVEEESKLADRLITCVTRGYSMDI